MSYMEREIHYRECTDRSCVSEKYRQHRPNILRHEASIMVNVDYSTLLREPPEPPNGGQRCNYCGHING